jgi:formyltetrahydrofolate-dependent phosphoribosylglycinamide formyltransferase
VPARIAVLASGSGSNLEAMLDHQDRLGEARNGTIALVASDRADARALDRARARDIAAVFIPDPSDPLAVDALLDAHAIDLVALAGYLRLVPPDVTRRRRGRIMNVHPTLLPAFGGRGLYGLRAHRAVLAAGSRVTGASVHFVDEAYDRGPVIAQWPVPVLRDDTPESLAARVLQVEHALYPRVVDAVASGRITLDGSNHVRDRAPSRAGAPCAFVLGAVDPSVLRESIDQFLDC